MEATSTPTTGTTTTTAPAPGQSATAAPTPAERPTFAQAFASDAAKLTEQTAQPGAPTTQAADATATEAPVNPSAEKTGEPPQDKWPQILENARTKAANEAITQYKEKVGWAETVDRAAYEEAAKIGALFQRDKPAYIRQVMAEALNNPELAPLVRSEAARVLGSRAPQPQSAVPDIPIVNEQGQVVGNLREIVSQHLAEFAAKELDPIKRDYATRQEAEKARQQEEQARQEEAQINRFADTTYERAVASLPMFKEHEKEIGAAMRSIPTHDQHGQEIDPMSVLQMAWAKVVPAKLNAVSQAKTLDELKTTAAASLANPAGSAVASTKRPKSFYDPSLKW